MCYKDKDNKYLKVGDTVSNSYNTTNKISSFSVIGGKPVVVYCNDDIDDSGILFLPNCYAGYDFCDEVSFVEPDTWEKFEEDLAMYIMPNLIQDNPTREQRISKEFTDRAKKLANTNA